MGGRGRSGSQLRRGSSSRVLVLLGAVGLLVGGLSACTSTAPQAVLNVPGNYVANLWNPPPGFSQGAGAGVLMCLDEASAVRLETGEGGQGSVGSIHLTWGDADYQAQNSGSAVVFTTPVLQPGCGLLTFVVDCCHVDNYLAIKATKV